MFNKKADNADPTDGYLPPAYLLFQNQDSREVTMFITAIRQSLETIPQFGAVGRPPFSSTGQEPARGVATGLRTLQCGSQDSWAFKLRAPWDMASVNLYLCQAALAILRQY